MMLARPVSGCLSDTHIVHWQVRYYQHLTPRVQPENATAQMMLARQSPRSLVSQTSLSAVTAVLVRIYKKCYPPLPFFDQYLASSPLSHSSRFTVITYSKRYTTELSYNYKTALSYSGCPPQVWLGVGLVLQ